MSKIIKRARHDNNCTLPPRKRLTKLSFDETRLQILGSLYCYHTQYIYFVLVPCLRQSARILNMALISAVFLGSEPPP